MKLEVTPATAICAIGGAIVLALIITDQINRNHTPPQSLWHKIAAEFAGKAGTAVGASGLFLVTKVLACSSASAV